jgi:uncharacterized protein YjiS (DUF1127 family)
MFANNVVVGFRNGARPNRGVRPHAGTVQGAWRWLKRTADVIASRRHLAEIDDRTLQDLGISRAQARFEASRPVWDLAPLHPHRWGARD